MTAKTYFSKQELFRRQADYYLLIFFIFLKYIYMYKIMRNFTSLYYLINTTH